MNMPGFTAETSLYKASGHYHMKGIHVPADVTIYPAQLDGPEPELIPGFPPALPPRGLPSLSALRYRCNLICDPPVCLYIWGGYRCFPGKCKRFCD